MKPLNFTLLEFAAANEAFVLELIAWASFELYERVVPLV
jgi:hypothetical protein